MAGVRPVIRGVGRYLPERIVPNSAFEHLDTSDEWIRTRTGILERRFAADGQLTSELAVNAARDALDDAGVEPGDIDLILLATSTPDRTFPSTAVTVQRELGITQGFAFDVQAVCAGFVYALANANALLRAGDARRALVIGAETFSRILDMRDRSTCILFGDGAGAVILENRPADGTNRDRGILATDTRSDGRYQHLLYVDGGVSSTQTAGFIRMDGKEVFRHAVNKLETSTRDCLTKAGLSTKDVDFLVPHQANLRIINKTAEKLGIPSDRVVATVRHHGNTSAASIPLALHAAVSAGSILPGNILVTNAIGGGLAWGSVVIRW
ncbi:MAG: ketoacyl-ACP synthase III [Rhodobacteraceae bacterium]|nr:ketoacyl-ACP synthase III [Paracoccaceae bacterium]